MPSARKATRGRVKSRRSARVTAPGSPGRDDDQARADRLARRADERLADRGEIARGGMGVITKVFDTRLSRHAALKVIDAEIATHPDALGRFMDEARITGQLDHPNIVPVYDVTVDPAGIPSALLMKLVEGETLTQRIGAAGPRSIRELTRLLEIFLKICDAVAFAHSRGVIHRDLKPDNVMLGEFGQVYVMDWGCAHILPRPKRGARVETAPRRTFVEPPGTVIGTPGYMAPEQARGATDELDERTDVFGLGGILYHILTGDAPYPAESASGAVALAKRGAPPPPQELSEHAPPGLCRIAMRALAPDRDDRFDSALDLKAEVETFLRGGSFFSSRTFAAGEIICREGDPADEAYVITAGHCEAFRTQRGERLPLRMLGPGDVFGEGAIFAAGARNASVAAIDEVTAVVVSREALHEELALDSWMGAFVRALALRYRDSEARNRIEHVAAEQARIIAAIIDHVTRAGAWVRPGVLEVPWSRVWATLGAELRLPEPVVLAAVARSCELSFDADRDMITLDLPPLVEG